LCCFLFKFFFFFFFFWIFFFFVQEIYFDFLVCPIDRLVDWKFFFKRFLKKKKKIFLIRKSFNYGHRDKGQILYLQSWTHFCTFGSGYLFLSNTNRTIIRYLIKVENWAFIFAGSNSGSFNLSFQEIVKLIFRHLFLNFRACIFFSRWERFFLQVYGLLSCEELSLIKKSSRFILILFKTNSIVKLR